MTRAALGLILLSVTITAFAQIMLKAGMSGSTVQRAIATGLNVQSVRTVLFSPLVIGGLFLYFGAAMVWLLVLSKVDVSLAYPFVALGFGLTAVFGWLLFGESLSLIQGAAILLISAGVVLLARG